MGAGNWSWRSQSGLSTFVVHIDAVRQDFDDYREDAEKEFVGYLKKTHPNLVQEGDEPSLAWAEENGLKSIIEDAIGDSFPYWDNQEGFYLEESRNRYDDLLNALVDASQRGDLPSTSVDADARVVASKKYAQLLLREWETYLYLAVGPTDELEEYLPAQAFDTKAELFVARCLAACEPANTSFLHVAGKPAAIELDDRERLMVRDGLRAAPAERLIDRIQAIANELDDQEEQDAAAEAKFLEDFGITTSELAVRRDDVEAILEFVNHVGELPCTVMEQYGTEYEQMRDELLSQLAAMEEQPMRPDTAWTSKRVDMRPYRDAAVIQLDGSAIATMIYGQHATTAVESAVPGAISIMSEEQLDAFVLKKVLEQYPHEAAKSLEGYFTLYTRGSSPSQQQEGALVYRGHLSWGNVAKAEQRTDEWVKTGGTATRLQLPVWYDYVPANQVREVLVSLPAPSSVVKSFFDANGDLKVTGMLVERRGDEMGQVYVTDSAAPDKDHANFRPVLVNGAWVEPTPVLENERGVSYGR